MRQVHLPLRWPHWLAALALGLLAGCSSSPDRPKPADLGPDPALLGVRQAWSSQVGAIDFPLQVKALGETVVLAGADGQVLALDARTGALRWRSQVGAPIAAGVGSDGRHAAVVTRDNELVVLEGDQIAWRARLTAQVFTAPLVAGERVFVLGADRSVSAFDARSGRRLWQNQRTGDALVLRQSGVLTAVGNTLVVGLAGHLVGMNPLNGNLVWDVPVSTPRGTNDIERLVDLVSGVSRQQDVLCVRAFQSTVGCVDTLRGALLWKKNAAGAVGVSGDERLVFGVETDGRVQAWRRADGEPAWSSERLRYRQLSAPLVLGRSLLVGDDTGVLHLLSRQDGSPLKRLATDGSAIASTPVAAGDTLVVVTRKGAVYGFLPE